MQVILFQNIEKLGMQGDVVNVANGYFRNYLGPRGIAVEATEATLRRLEMKRKKLKAEAEQQLNEAETIAQRLAAVELNFVEKATDKERLFGSISAGDIAEKLTEAGYAVERRQVALPEPIKTVGAHKVKIKLHSHVMTEIKVVVEAEGAAETTATEAPGVSSAAEDTQA
ncbi:MAG: 50S ribosomal protein L9 [bacterium]|nr:50S ribosomal protein L9 [bacterium]